MFKLCSPVGRVKEGFTIHVISSRISKTTNKNAFFTATMMLNLFITRYHSLSVSMLRRLVARGVFEKLFKWCYDSFHVVPFRSYLTPTFFDDIVGD